MFHAAVQVRPLLDQSQPGPLCDHVQGSLYYEAFNIQAIAVHCPARRTSKSDGNQDPRTLDHDGPPDLLVIVNYTTLLIDPNTIIDMRRSSIEIRIGMINDTEQVLHRTVPVSIPPGVNLLANLNFEIRQLFKKPSLSAFGLFDSISTFSIARMVHVFNDPQAGISSHIPHSPGISTLRAYAMVDPSEWVIVQDNRDKSVVRGLADIGGL